MLVTQFEQSLPPFKHQQDAYDEWCRRISAEVPYYGSFMEMGCISGSMEIQVNYFGCGKRMSLQELHDIEPHRRISTKSGRTISTRSLIDGEYRLNRIIRVHDKGIRSTFEVALRSGKTLRATEDHELMQISGWIPIRNLFPGDLVFTQGKPEPRIKLTPQIPTNCGKCGSTQNVAKSPLSRYFGWCRSCIRLYIMEHSDGRTLTKDGYIKVVNPDKLGTQILEHILIAEQKLGRKLLSTEKVHHKNDDTTDNAWTNLIVTEHHHEHHRWYQNLNKEVFAPKEDEVESVRFFGSERVFDIEMESPGNSFLANGVLVHNCGKTKVALNEAAMLWLSGRVRSTVVIAPKGTYLNWFDKEIPEHMSPTVPYQVAYWTSAMRKHEREALELLMQEDSSKLKILCFNIEAMIKDSSAVDWLGKFTRKYPPFVIIDESTTIKNPKAKRTKLVLARGSGVVRYRTILTGNPIPNGPLDLWSQSEFLSENCLGYGNYFAFRNRFAVMVKARAGGGREFPKVVGYRDLDKLQERMRSIAFTIKKADCLDLPEKLYQFLDVEMGPTQRRAYNQMLEDSYVELEGGGRVTAEMVLTRELRLHQIVCGFMQPKGEDRVVFFDEPNDRLETLLQTCEEYEDKVIVWADYVPNIEQVVRALKEKFGQETVGHFYGDTSDDDRRRYKEEFQDPDSRLRFFVSNPAAGRFGNTLTQGTLVFYYSNSFNLEHRQQSEDRSHRYGLKKRVLYLDLRCRGTVDDRRIAVLRKKRQLTDDLVVSNWRWILGGKVA